jgi:hypothetical protein
MGRMLWTPENLLFLVIMTQESSALCTPIKSQKMSGQKRCAYCYLGHTDWKARGVIKELPWPSFQEHFLRYVLSLLISVALREILAT